MGVVAYKNEQGYGADGQEGFYGEEEVSGGEVEGLGVEGGEGGGGCEGHGGREGWGVCWGVWGKGVCVNERWVVLCLRVRLCVGCGV